MYLGRHHDHRDIWPFYRHADFCMVTSLHDGMNLVAKEYLSVASDERGMLVLSRFTGAAHELRDALLVNPYDLEETAEAIRAAVEMPPEERRARMHRWRARARAEHLPVGEPPPGRPLAPVRPRRRGQARGAGAGARGRRELRRWGA